MLVQRTGRATRAFRAGLVRRVPAPEELAKRKLLVLTDRDRELLNAVYTHGFLTTELVQLAFFPATGPDGRRSPSSKAYERLRKLWLFAYLERVELPMARSQGGRCPFLYALGRRGVDLVTATGGGTAAVRLRRFDRLDHVFVDHDLKSAALWANLKALIRDEYAGRVRHFRWISERELRARRLRVRDPQRAGRWLPFLPDGFFELWYASGMVQCVLVEIDMGTLSLDRFRRKLRAFEAFLAQDLFHRSFGRSHFEVAVLTTSRRRLDHLWQATRQEVADVRWRDYQFATLDVLDPDEFPDADWISADNEWQTLLYSVDAAEGSGQDGID